VNKIVVIGIAASFSLALPPIAMAQADGDIFATDVVVVATHGGTFTISVVVGPQSAPAAPATGGCGPKAAPPAGCCGPASSAPTPEQQAANNAALAAAANAPPEMPTYDPNDPPINQWQQAYNHSDYNKVLELAPVIGGGDPEQIRKAIGDAANMAVDMLSDKTATQAQQQNALEFLGRIADRLDEMANAVGDSDPTHRDSLRRQAGDARLMRQQYAPR